MFLPLLLLFLLFFFKSISLPPVVLSPILITPSKSSWDAGGMVLCGFVGVR